MRLPGTAAGDRGPVREGVTLAGEPTGDGEGPRMPGRWGEVCGEKGDWAGLLCSPWLLDTPEVLTPGLKAPSVPVGRSSMEPDKSLKEKSNRTWVDDDAAFVRLHCNKWLNKFIFTIHITNLLLITSQHISLSLFHKVSVPTACGRICIILWSDDDSAADEFSLTWRTTKQISSSRTAARPTDEEKRASATVLKL